MTNRDRSYREFCRGVERIGVKENGQPIIKVDGWHFLLPAFVVLANQDAPNCKLRLAYSYGGYRKSIGFRNATEFEETLDKLLTLVQKQGYKLYRNVVMTTRQKRTDYVFGVRIPEHVYIVRYMDGFVIRRAVYVTGCQTDIPDRDCGVFYNKAGFEEAVMKASLEAKKEISDYNRSMCISKKEALEKYRIVTPYDI
ncbi:hypothetical protein D3C85_15160 [compost metagenome]